MDVKKYEKLCLTMTKSILHSPMGCFNYKKKNPTIPEIGICLDFLNHLAVNKDGKVSICVRFDPKGLGVIGDVSKQPLAEIWNSKKRLKWLKFHTQGHRDNITLYTYCKFWGVPTVV